MGKSVKYYDTVYGGGMEVREQGDWVARDDYEELEAEVARLRELLTEALAERARPVEPTSSSGLVP